MNEFETDEPVGSLSNEICRHESALTGKQVTTIQANGTTCSCCGGELSSCSCYFCAGCGNCLACGSCGCE